MPNNQQSQAQKQVSAYEKQTVHEMFRLSLEWLEKYIEVVYPNYRIRKQIYDNNIKRQDANDPSKVESMFTGSLFGFKATIEIAGKPQFLYEEVKKEYYKWLDSAGVDVNNCPPRLKHFLFEINEILEGRGEKFERDIANRKNELDPDSAEYQKAVNEVFTYIQSPLEKARNEYENLKGKTYGDIKIENNFSSSGEGAEQAFKQMAGRHNYQGFSFISQKEQQVRNPSYRPLVDNEEDEFLGSSSSTRSSNVIQPSSSQLNIPHLTGQELKDDYLPVRNESEVSFEQLGEIQRVERSLMNSEVPLNTAIPVANGSLAFVVVPNGILWYKRIGASYWTTSTRFTQKPNCQQKETQVSQSQKNDNSIGTAGILTLIGTASVLTIGGAVVLKKKLSKRSK